MVINSNNSISFKANITGKLHKHVGGLVHILKKRNPEEAKILEGYLATIEKFNKDCKIVCVDTPLPSKPKDIPQKKMFFLVDNNYPEAPGTKEHYIPLYTKTRQSADDRMYLITEDVRAISENFPIDPARWQTGDILIKNAQEVYTRGIIISSAHNHYEKLKHINISHPQQPKPKIQPKPKKNQPKPQQRQPINEVNIPAVSRVIEPMPIKRYVVSPYRRPENALLVIKPEKPLSEIIIQRQIEKFDNDLKSLYAKYPKRTVVKDALEKLPKLLENDKLVYLQNNEGYNQIWLASEIGKANSVPVFDAPLANTIALRQLLNNLEERQSKHLSLLG